MRARQAPLVLFLLTSFACLGCDQLTKEVARVHLVDSVPIGMPFAMLDLALAQNAGAFLGLGSWLPGSLRVLVFQVGAPLILGWICLAFLRESLLSTRDVLALPVRPGMPERGITGLMDSVHALRYAVQAGLALY